MTGFIVLFLFKRDSISFFLNVFDEKIFCKRSGVKGVVDPGPEAEEQDRGCMLSALSPSSLKNLATER